MDVDLDRGAGWYTGKFIVSPILQPQPPCLVDTYLEVGARAVCMGETVTTMGLRHLALIEVAVMFLAVTSAGIADAASPLEGDQFIHPAFAADGVTSDDVALAKAAEACGAAGSRLVLPAGRILLTGAATIVLKHCAMVGAGTPAGDNTGDYGTTILLTSETVPPFRLETGFQISGINFYWPNQKTGKTPYPPLFSDGGKEKGFNHGVIDNIVIVNAYDGMTTTPAADQATSKSPTPRCGPITIFLT
jgi:hypothetical protein